MAEGLLTQGLGGDGGSLLTHGLLGWKKKIKQVAHRVKEFLWFTDRQWFEQRFDVIGTPISIKQQLANLDAMEVIFDDDPELSEIFKLLRSALENKMLKEYARKKDEGS